MNMKKLFLGFIVILMSGFARASNEFPFAIADIIGPTYATGTSVTGTSSSISAAGAGVRNCLTELTTMSSTIASVAIINGSLASGTTIYSLTALAAGTVHNMDRLYENAICGDPNTALTVNVTSGTVNINYSGYKRSRP